MKTRERLAGEDGGVAGAVLEAKVERIKCADGLERIAAFRKVVAECQCLVVDGTLVDLFSASVVCQVYDAVNDANKEKFRALPVVKMARVAFKLAY